VKLPLGRLAILAVLLLLTLSLHHNILPLPQNLHHLLHQTDLHRRFCYLPIVLGALWFGLRGGLLTASVISVAVLPLALRTAGPLTASPDFLEILFYLALGSLAGVLVDLRERERERKETLERDLAAAERHAALGRAASGIAHEVRTPLGSILGAAEILAEDYPEEHPRRRFYAILVEEGRRLGRVVDDFLDLGRTPVLRPSSVAVADVVSEALASVGDCAAARQVRLEGPQSAEPILVRADADRLRQALINLIRNAVEASPSGGTVRVGIEMEPGSLNVVVSDQGAGVPRGEESRIFEPFFTGRRDGTGLGLALALQIARAHEGSLSLEPGRGRGATFVLRLPVRSGGVS